MDYEDFITFEEREGIQEYLDTIGGAGSVQSVPDFLEVKTRQALSELYSTPEGKELIENASQEAGGKISILLHFGGSSSAVLDQQAILIGTDSGLADYFSPETNSYHPVTLQRLLAHELEHMAEHHTLEHNSQIYQAREAETISHTNVLMQKYYSEPPRSTDHKHEMRYRGALNPEDTYPLNESFVSEENAGVDETINLDSGFRDRLIIHLMEISNEDAQELSPETQALRNNLVSYEKFSELLDDYLKDEDTADYILGDIPQNVIDGVDEGVQENSYEIEKQVHHDQSFKP